MIDRRRPTHLTVTLGPGEARDHVPAHLDVLVGAARPAGTLDRGPLDRTVNGCAGAFRVEGVFHSRNGLGRVGARSRGFDDLEEALGLSRTYRLRLAEPDRSGLAVRRLRELDVVESAAVELLATAPATVVAPEPPAPPADVLAPHRMVGSAEALRMEPGDERVTVAVVDTGVSLGHPEFQRRLLSGYDVVELGLGRISADTTLVGDSHGRDFAPADDVGHGSHVAGVIGAQGWQVPPGLAGRALLLPIRVLAGARTEGRHAVTGVGALGDIDVGLKVAVDLGARVMNLSFGTPARAIGPEEPRPHEAVVAYAAAHGVVMVAASGNSGLAEEFHPAVAPEVIAVGSVSAAGERSAFSTYGPHLSLCAPGESVVSVGRRGYRLSSGTSHAAPFVTGVAALLIARARRSGVELTAPEIRSLLESTACPSPSPAAEAGAGVLDAPAALRALDGRLHAGRQPLEGVSHA